MKKLVVIAHNIRSAHNIGALLRLCDGIGVEKVYLSGYSPYPKQMNDTRLPHEAKKTHAKIAKTALGSEKNTNIIRERNIESLLRNLKESNYKIIGLEQRENSTKLSSFKSNQKKIALLLGEEVAGINPLLLAICDQIVEIPMFGNKESHNVVEATAMALYHLRFIDT